METRGRPGEGVKCAATHARPRAKFVAGSRWRDRAAPPRAATLPCEMDTSSQATARDEDTNGVDLALTRSMLKRTPDECLELLEDFLLMVESVERDEPLP